MVKGYKTEILFSPENIRLFNKNCGVKKFVYNLFITVNKQRYEKTEKYLSAYDFSKWLNNEFLKDNPEYNWIKEVSSKNIKETIIEIDKAFKRFFIIKEKEIMLVFIS